MHRCETPHCFIEQSSARCSDSSEGSPSPTPATGFTCFLSCFAAVVATRYFSHRMKHQYTVWKADVLLRRPKNRSMADVVVGSALGIGVGVIAAVAGGSSI